MAIHIPSKTLYLMFSAILRHMRYPNAPNILSKNNPAFNELHNTLDGIFKKKTLRADGVGAAPKHAEPFSKEE